VRGVAAARGILVDRRFGDAGRRVIVEPRLVGELGDDILVDHAGTRIEDGRLLTAGGRVPALGARGDDVSSARQRAYEAVAGVRFEGMQYRTDIGAGAAEERR